MENILGINEVRIKLSTLLKELAKKKEPVIITSKSKPRAVLLDYNDYRNLVKSKEKQDRLILAEAVAKIRLRAMKAGLTEEDVKREIKKVRSS